MAGPVGRLLERIGPRDPLGSVARVWPDAVGSAMADHSNPVSLTAGRLTVECSGSVYAQELELMSRKVLAALSGQLGEGVVTGLRFTVATRRRSG